MITRGSVKLVLATAVSLAGVVSAAWDTTDTAGAEPKYFHESASAGPHYDFRYAEWTLDDDEQRDTLRAAIQTFLTTFNAIGVETWLMHGTLLGWWWGKKILPWDVDADFQVAEADMHFLAQYYNMTTYYYTSEAFPKGRFYLLDINPHFTHRELDDWRNAIDARWIDMDSGLYVDITTARYSLEPVEGEGMLFEKSGHRFRDTYLYPLLETTFEGVPAKIPYEFEKMLQSEYGSDAMTNLHFHDHTFSETKMEWISDEL